jgi:hypothetical protein
MSTTIRSLVSCALVLAVCVASAAVAHADIIRAQMSNVPSVVRDDGTVQVVLNVRHDAANGDPLGACGTPPCDYAETYIASGSTLQELRDDLSRKIAEKNRAMSARGVVAGIPTGTNIPIVKPADPSTTAAQVCNRDASHLARLRQGVANGITAWTAAANALATDMNTRCADSSVILP